MAHARAAALYQDLSGFRPGNIGERGVSAKPTNLTARMTYPLTMSLLTQRAVLFGRRAVKFLVVRFGLLFGRVHSPVLVVRRRIDRVDF